MYTASFEPNSKFNRIYILEIQIESSRVAKFRPNLIYVWYLILLFGISLGRNWVQIFPNGTRLKFWSSSFHSLILFLRRMKLFSFHYSIKQNGSFSFFTIAQVFNHFKIFIASFVITTFLISNFHSYQLHGMDVELYKCLLLM